MSVNSRRVFVVLAVTTVLVVMPAFAQKESEKVLQGNPYRQVGGSCVYGKGGELLFTPKDVRCANRREDAPGEGARGTAERFSSLPPELRTEANALVDSHAHAAEDIAELRRAVSQDDKAKAMELSDELVKELVAHLTREQAFFDKLSAEHQAH